jgi:hypothetical protein
VTESAGAHTPTIDIAAALGINPSSSWSLTEADLSRLLTSLGLDPKRVAIALPVLAMGVVDEVPFEVRVGLWRLDLPAAAARGLVSGAILTGALLAIGEASIPAAVLGVVVPALFDLERVTLAPSERYVYAVLLNAPATAAGKAMPVEAWYAHLPARVQDEVTLLEFRDIVGALEDAGTLEVSDLGEVSVEVPSTRRLVRLALPAGPAAGEFQ